MPALKYKPKRDLPIFIREAKTFSPTELTKIILAKRNEIVTPQSITMFFQRHREIEAKLKEEVVEDQKENAIVDASIFQNGTFEELPSVKTWVKEMTLRQVQPLGIANRVNALKRVCQGLFTNHKIDLHEEGIWTFKHPDRLTIEDAQELLFVLMKRGIETSGINIPLRSFFSSKGLVVGQKISGAKSKGFGKYADLYVPMDKLLLMLDVIKQRSFSAYVADIFMLRYGPRINATLDLTIEDYNPLDHTIKGIDKGRLSKGRKPFKKYLDAQMVGLLGQVVDDRKSGAIFSVTDQEMSALNRLALKAIMPELEPKIDMPNHFWRHQFAQHMLRATGWNYAKVASLGNWTPQALEESYGKPPPEIIEGWAKEASIEVRL